jgi:hypothetical protein
MGNRFVGGEAAALANTEKHCYVEIATYGYLVSLFGLTHRVPPTEVQTLDLSTLGSRQG